MKIGILTLPLHINYGGILQAWALQTVLQRMGHDVDVFDKRHNNRWFYPGLILKRWALKIFGFPNICILSEHKNIRLRKLIRQNTDRFIERYINKRIVISLYDIRDSEYDAIVVGSDQIWRQKYFTSSWGNRMADAFLRFTDNWKIKRLSYAASFGLDNINEYSLVDKNECRDALMLFDSVSVRESSGVTLCRDLFGINAVKVLDPTMLLSAADYIALANDTVNSNRQGGLLCYFLDSDTNAVKITENICNMKGLSPYYVNADTTNDSLPLSERIQPSVEQWLQGFVNADYVVTDSFHACVFSIIFGKQFIVVGNATRGLSRIESLLKEFGLEERLFVGNPAVLPEDYDVTDVQRILANKRQESLNFLSNIIG